MFTGPASDSAFAAALSQLWRNSRQWLILLALMLLLPAASTGCQSLHTAARFQLQGDRRTSGSTELAFTEALYAFDQDQNLTLLLLDGPRDAPRQALVLRSFYTPAAGRTPISRDATNTTLQYLVMAEAETLGVYSGAGFLYFHNRAGNPRIKASLWQANLLLIDATEAFDDRFGRSTLRGRLQATRDDAAVQELVRHLSMLASERLGYPRLVGATVPYPGGRNKESTLSLFWPM